MKKIYINIKYQKGKSVRGYILDISRTGISMTCSKKVNKNTIIDITTEKKILLPMKGKVASILKRRTKIYGYRLGIKFISIDKKQKKILDKFIHKIERRKAIRLSLI